jgi:endogenous inhibitor of DNA gyrase (YacG/DUF329 family)
MTTNESNNITSENKNSIKQHKCPICSKLTSNQEYRPFCSKRCSDIDLGNWFGEKYVIEGITQPIEDDNID